MNISLFLHSVVWVCPTARQAAGRYRLCFSKMRTTLILLFLTLKLLSQKNDSINTLYYIPNDFKLSVEQDTFSTKFKTSNYNELLNSLNSEKKYEKCLAFHYLLKYRETKIFEILLQNIFDTTNIRIQEGCILITTTVGDYFFQFADENRYPENNVKLTFKQKQVIDSVILYSESIGPNSLYEVLSCIKIEEKYYNRIRYLALNKNNYKANVILAKYNKKENYNSIIDLLNSNNDKEQTIGIECVFYSSDESFMKNLINIFNKEWKEEKYSYSKWYYLYQSLAKYNSLEIYSLFEKTITCKDEFRNQTLSVYLKKAIENNHYYISLKSKIKLDDFHLREFESLKKDDNNCFK